MGSTPTPSTFYFHLIGNDMRNIPDDIIKVGRKKYTVQEWNGLDTDVLTTCGKTIPVKNIEIINWSYKIEDNGLIRVYYKDTNFTQITKGASTYKSWIRDKNNQDWYWVVFGYMTRELRKFKCEKHEIFHIRKYGLDRCPKCADDNQKEFKI